MKTMTKGSILLMAFLLFTTTAACQWGGGKSSSPSPSGGAAVVHKVTPQEAHNMLQKGGVTLVDVREQSEYDTGHIAGAIYGSPVKNRQGRTSLGNVYLCGTDQGFLGITGAMLSGISMANYHILQKSA